VRVQGHRVGAVNAGQHRPSLRCESGEAAIGRIHVQPQTFPRADIGKVPEGIDGAGVGRPGAGTQRDRDTPGAAVGANSGGHRFG
jgi:hypothetical protein